MVRHHKKMYNKNSHSCKLPHTSNARGNHNRGLYGLSGGCLPKDCPCGRFNKSYCYNKDHDYHCHDCSKSGNGHHNKGCQGHHRQGRYNHLAVVFLAVIMKSVQASRKEAATTPIMLMNTAVLTAAPSYLHTHITAMLISIILDAVTFTALKAMGATIILRSIIWTWT